MADEPSWDEIFNPTPANSEPKPAPAAQDGPPAPPFSPPAIYPPTVAFPTQAAPAQPAQPDFFAAPAPAAAQQPLPPQAAPAAAPSSAAAPFDPFADLFGNASPSAPPELVTPAAPFPAAPTPAPAADVRPNEYTPELPFPVTATARFTPREEDDPFAALFGTPASSEPAAPATTAVAQTPPAADPILGGVPQSRREARESSGRRATRHDLPNDGGSLAGEASVLGAGFGTAGFGTPGSGAASSGAPGSGAPATSAPGFAFDGLVSQEFGSGGTGAGGSGAGGDSGGGRGGSGRDGGAPRKKRRLLWLKITLPIVLVLAAVGGVGAYGWVNYNTQVRALLGIPLPTDYVGSGNGEQVIVTIQTGDIGSDIANTLHDKGVTMTFDSFYNLLLKQTTEPNFLPGNYSLQKEMSAQSALDALLDPANKVTDKLLITEGTTLPKALEIISETTGIPLADVQTASTDLASFGIPAEAPSLEGYLFPATYQLDGGESAHDVLKLLVDTMFQHLDTAGVPVADRHTVLTKASIIQREAGPNTDDFYKIARVFQNRIDQGINLESDATVAYGTGNLKTVYTTDAERADASNPYNTYANPGLPIGPIGLPGDLAIDAALHPVDGPWLFFVPINLQTGETVFSETVEEHDAAVQQLHDWCAASAENDAYCQ